MLSASGHDGLAADQYRGCCNETGRGLGSVEIAADGLDTLQEM